MNRKVAASSLNSLSYVAAPPRACLCALALALLFVCGSSASARLQVRSFPQSSQASLTPLQREIERLRARLSSADTEERREAVMRLGAMARPDSSRAALPALKDEAVIVRATAARAILSLPAWEAAAALLPLLADKQEFVRREAAYALGETRSRTAVEALATALARDKEAGVRGAAAVALGQIGDEAATPVLTEAIGRRIARTGFLNRIRFRRTEENEFVRRSAAVALGQLKSRAAVPALIGALASERAGDDVRREAARALGLIGDPSALPTLRAALATRDPYLSEIAAEAIRLLESAAKKVA
ncbi:MAG TPA: HEAT repeat domain-containing protein [Pyrinomonadaceae bacterium]|nr:HEAT repeat domain-containing protein [Pyrinomonadaceae bacterium]